ncbi:1-acyl-sn-glycerol-3-phosphate acyltransferase [Sporanaerobium hydrogeniformans]|uniref:1-acyl-sn-glycerol-3-phosphate acyltransferase n=1 Tax=Sporanaerobium hydrogeniformans TaxID=3072179 RepID=A0AC61DBN4_9FIRM|nr:lysophospholipid acyltransferase family protein [Sporanaerobium hydrogeniformans]PHV70650.1 1-acyl-sn-glycerol-3-phosphate acyltransferase [Sporanaerobium hydrogeniformans]
MRTIIWYIGFVVTLLGNIPRLWKVNTLKKQGKMEEAEAYIHHVTSKWALGNVKRSGARVEVFGLENLPEKEPVVYISNHQSNFDIAILMSYIDRPKGFIAKVETLKIPLVRTWMRHIHCVFMDRSTLKGSAGAIVEGIKFLKEGHSLVIFPEGTRSKGDKMGSFKEASFKLATKPKVPIIPITIDGTYKLMEQNNNRIKPANVKLTIHPPLSTAHLTKEELQELPSKVYELIASKLPASQTNLSKSL